MKQKELDEVLRLHKLWLNDEEGGVRADLRRENLRNANLRSANLSDANLMDADLSYAILGNADLSGANLMFANLNGANLMDADLRDVSLDYCIGNNREIKTLQFDPWTVTYTKDVIQIGCENHTIDKWFAFTDEEINEMDARALVFWKKYKSIIRTLVNYK